MFSIRELEVAFDEERDACKAEKIKVASLEESLAVEREKLQDDITEKLQIITDLSKQLEVHQKNFDALKGELSQVSQRFLKYCRPVTLRLSASFEERKLGKFFRL